MDNKSLEQLPANLGKVYRCYFEIKLSLVKNVLSRLLQSLPLSEHFQTDNLDSIYIEPKLPILNRCDSLISHNMYKTLLIL